MTIMTDYSKMKIRCYVSTNIGSDLVNIKNILDTMGVEILATGYPGMSLSAAIEKAILSSDFVLGVLNSSKNNENVLFELGFAKGLGKPIVVIVPPELSNIPQFLSDVSFIRANTTDSTPIKYSLERSIPFFTKSKISKKFFPRKHQFHVQENIPITEKVIVKVSEAKSEISDSLVDSYINKLQDPNLTELDILKIVELVLKRGENIVVENFSVHSDDESYKADLAIWDDKLEPYISNPLLIEIKRKISQDKIDLIKRSFRSYYQKGKSRWLLVLYLEGPEEIKQSITTIGSQILFLKIEKLLEQMKTQSFAKVIRDSRNYYVHGIDYGADYGDDYG